MPEKNEKLESTRLSVLRATATADRAYRSQLLIAKSGAINALAAGEITREQYMELTGQAVAETLKDRYDMAVERAGLDLAVYVQNELITAEEYQDITGHKVPD